VVERLRAGHDLRRADADRFAGTDDADWLMLAERRCRRDDC
jgi:hypothetical protein